MTLEGIEFINAGPEVVVDYLTNRKTWHLDTAPSNLLIKNEGKYLKLHVTGDGREYPLRKSFLWKLLKWYSFPLTQLNRISGDTAASICNDYLLNIRREYVIVRFDGDQAVSVTSPDYNELTDLEVIKRVSPLGITGISRNDFMMRVTTRERVKFTPVKGDDCGLGLSVINSETGFRALSISHFLLRYICSNGAMIRIDKEQEKKIHYGNKPYELTDFLNEQVTLAENKKEKIKESLLNLSKKTLLPDSNYIKKLRPLLRNYESIEGLDLYTIFNLITETAKKFDLSKRIYWESVAGELMN